MEPIFGAYDRALRRLALVVGLLFGCGPVTSDPADEWSGSTGASVASSSTGVASSSTGFETSTSEMSTSSGPGVDVPDLCAFNDAFECSEPLDCTEVTCGGLDTPYDRNGCLRSSCSTANPCPDGHVCIGPHNWGGHGWEVYSCWEGADGCRCGNPSWHLWPPEHYCVPTSDLPNGAATPEAYCAGLASVECDAEPLGICRLLRVVEVLDVDTCVTGLPYDSCEPIAASRSLPPDRVCPLAFIRTRDDGRVELTNTPLDRPGGLDPERWRACSIQHPACECACDLP